jgi:hypothetical protein
LHYDDVIELAASLKAERPSVECQAADAHDPV